MIRYYSLPPLYLLILLLLLISLLYHTLPLFQAPPNTSSSSLSFHGSPPITNNPISSLASLASLPPPVPPSPSCHPPSLPSIPSCHNQTGLTGKLLTQPTQLVLFILFGFEVDTLEIALYEQLDLVTMVFIVEGTRTHRGVSYV